MNSIELEGVMMIVCIFLIALTFVLGVLFWGMLSRLRALETAQETTVKRVRELQKNQINRAEWDELIKTADNRAVKNEEAHQLFRREVELLVEKGVDIECTVDKVRDSQGEHHKQQVDKDRKWYERVDALQEQLADMEKRIPPPRLRDKHGRYVSRKKRKEMKKEQEAVVEAGK